MAGSAFKLGKVAYTKQDITSAAGTTTLSNNSDYYQYVTGSTTQTIKLPDATTMVAALGFVVVNANSAGNVTVTDNGSNTLATLSPGQSSEFVVDSVSTANGVWMVLTGTGSGAVPSTSFSATAGENLALNDAVYICNSTSDNSGGARTVGRVYRLDVNNSFRNAFAGFSIAAVTSGNVGTIQVSGELAGFSGIPVGLQIWGSTSTVGGFQTTIPTTASLIVPLGQGSTTTAKLLINSALFCTANISNPSTIINGFAFGGSNGSDLSSIDKMVFATETVALSSGSLSATVRDGACGFGSLAAYILGGVTRVNRVLKFTFSGETGSNLGAILGSGIQGGIGAQSNTKAYVLGGDNGSPTTNIDSVIFSSDTRQSVSATLPSVTEQTSGCTNAGVAGYTFGGDAPTSAIQKLVFSGETTSTLSATISNSTSAIQGTYSSLKGYREGGLAGTTTIDALTFSGETRATLSATLNAGRGNGSAFSSSNKGYAFGGNVSGATSIDALVFATETNGITSSTLTTTRDSVPSGAAN